MVHKALSPSQARWGHICPAGLKIMVFGSLLSRVPPGRIDLGLTMKMSR